MVGTDVERPENASDFHLIRTPRAAVADVGGDGGCGRKIAFREVRAVFGVNEQIVFFVKGVALPPVFGKQGFGENGDVDLIVSEMFHQKLGEKTHAVQFPHTAL